MAITVTRAGEAPQTMSDRNYVRSCLILANFSDPDPAEVLTNSYLSIRANRVTVQFYTAPDALEERVKKARALQSKLRAALGDAASGIKAARRRHRTTIDVQLEGIEVLTDLRLEGDGHVVHEHRYIPRDDEAALALLWMFLLDPRRSYGSELRQCALAGCGRFFLAETNTAGGPRRSYCRPEHTEIANRQGAADRQARLRERKKRSGARK